MTQDWNNPFPSCLPTAQEFETFCDRIAGTDEDILEGFAHLVTKGQTFSEALFGLEDGE